MPFRKKLEETILFNGQRFTEIKNSRARRAVINTIEKIATDKALLQNIVSEEQPVYNLITESPAYIENIICDVLNLNKDTKDKIQKIYIEQLKEMFSNSNSNR